MERKWICHPLSIIHTIGTMLNFYGGDNEYGP